MRISIPNGLKTQVNKYFPKSSQWTWAVFGTTALLLLAASTTKAQCTTGGCTDNSSILSNACESCTASCDRLSAAGAGCGMSIACRPNPGGLADFVFGDPCGCGGHGGGCGVCVGSGCGGNFWNNLGCGSGGRLARGLTSLLFGSDCSDAVCGDESDGGAGCDNGDAGCELASGVGLLGGGSGLLARCCGGDCEPGAGYVGHREPPIFCGMPAPTYPVPHAVPQHVGYTRLTYPPFMPHHSLPHYRHTYSYRHAPGMSRTTVHWGSPIGRDILAKLHHLMELPR